MAARCPGCGYTYRVEEGDEHEGFAAGTAWADVPDSWCCPDCGVREKVDFVPLARRWPTPRLEVMSPAPTMRERIVGAAAAMTTESGWSAVTMGALADRVGVSRQTVYNEVGTKPGLAEAMILHELDRFLGVVTAAFDAHPTTWSRRSGPRRAGCSSWPRTTSSCTRWSPPPTGPTPSCCRC